MTIGSPGGKLVARSLSPPPPFEAPNPSPGAPLSTPPSLPAPVREPRTRLRLRRIGRRLLWAALFATFAVAALELAVRFLWPQPTFYSRPGLYVEDPFLGHRMRPGLVAEVGNVAEFTTRVHINSLGLRGPELGPHKAGVLRILVLGDSFTFGTGVEDEAAFPARLAAELTREGVPAEGLNAGIGGFGIPDEVAWYERYGRALRPDLIVLGVFPGNDLQDAAPGRPALAVIDGEILDRADRRRSSVSHWLYLHSQLFALLKYSLPRPVDRALRRVFHLPEPGALRGLRDEMALYRLGNRPLAEAGGAATERALRHLRELAREDGAEVAALLLPSDLEADEGDWGRALRTLRLDPHQVDRTQTHRILATALARQGVPALDLTPGFATALRGGAILFYRHDRHYTAEGHSLIARQAALFLRTRSSALRASGIALGPSNPGLRPGL